MLNYTAVYLNQIATSAANVDAGFDDLQRAMYVSATEGKYVHYHIESSAYLLPEYKRRLDLQGFSTKIIHVIAGVETEDDSGNTLKIEWNNDPTT